MTKIIDDHFEIEVDDLIPDEEIGHHLRLKKFLNIAKNLTQYSLFDTYKFGAVITVKDKVVAKGWNKAKSHPMQKQFNNEFRPHMHDNSEHGIHAELDALNKIKNMNIDLKKAEITIYRIGKDGKPKMGRPCAGCMAAIKQSGIPIINYTTPDGIATEFILNKDVKVKKSKKTI